MVFTLDHHDGSCPYTRKKDGTEIPLNVKAPFGTSPTVENKLDIRVDDIKKLADDILKPTFFSEQLGFPDTVKLNE